MSAHVEVMTADKEGNIKPMKDMGPQECLAVFEGVKKMIGVRKMALIMTSYFFYLLEDLEKTNGQFATSSLIAIINERDDDKRTELLAKLADFLNLKA